MPLGQTLTPDSRLVTVTKSEADDFVRSATEVTQYVIEHSMTSRVFCQGQNPVVLATSATVEAARIKKLIAANALSYQISTDAINALHLLTECALKITHHMDLTNKIGLVGGSITVTGLVWKQPILSWIGVGVVALSQTLGPLFRIPILE